MILEGTKFFPIGARLPQFEGVLYAANEGSETVLNLDQGRTLLSGFGVEVHQDKPWLGAIGQPQLHPLILTGMFGRAGLDASIDIPLDALPFAYIVPLVAVRHRGLTQDGMLKGDLLRRL